MFRRIPTLTRPLLGFWLVFFVNGAVLSSWAPRIPEVAERLAMSDAALGAALFGLAAGSLPALLLTDRLLHRFDGRTVCLVSAPAFAAGLPAIAAAPGPVGLWLVLAALGAASGVLDVAMNATAIEHQRRRAAAPVLSRLHGGYSLGVLCGAAGGAAATAAGLSIGVHFAVVAGVLLALLAVAGPCVPRTVVDRSRPDASETAADEDAAAEDGGAPSPAGSPSPARVITPAVAVVAVAGLLLEGVLTDWSALLVARDHGAGNTVGATVVVAFSLAMFLSRSAGDWIVPALGRRRWLLLAALVACAGTTTGLLVPGWPAVYVGVVLVGLFLGPVFPVALDLAAERAPRSVATATAAVSAVGYLAHLGGPPLIGVLAHSLGLPTTVALVGAAAGVMLAAGAVVLFDPARRPARGAEMRDDR